MKNTTDYTMRFEKKNRKENQNGQNKESNSQMTAEDTGIRRKNGRSQLRWQGHLKRIKFIVTSV